MSSVWSEALEIGLLFSIYMISPLSGSISGVEYPLENTALSTVDGLEEGTPDALEVAPLIVFVELNAVAFELESIP